MTKIDEIELLEIIEVDEVPTTRPQRKGIKEKCWKATLGLKDFDGNVVLRGTWYLSKKDVPDSSILPLVRCYLHFVCKNISESTQDWALDDTQRKALTRQSKAPS